MPFRFLHSEIDLIVRRRTASTENPIIIKNVFQIIR
jgi:hypothetical protein